MDKMMDKDVNKARSEVKNPQVFNGLVMSIFVYWALWFSTSLIMHLAK
jgi:hypothetical protein